MSSITCLTYGSLFIFLLPGEPILQILSGILVASWICLILRLEKLVRPSLTLYIIQTVKILLLLTNIGNLLSFLVRV